MLKFYLPVKRTKYTSNQAINQIMVGSLGTYKNLVLRKVLINKCDKYDDLLFSFLDEHNIKDIKRTKHFCYDLINYGIRNLKCFINDFGEYFYSIDIPLYNPFGSKTNVDLILRLIEYGDNDKIKPYNLFNKSLLELKDLHNKKLNLL